MGVVVGSVTAELVSEGSAKVKRKNTIPAHVRFAVMTRDEATCRYCEHPGDCLDHVIPWSKGGEDTTANLVVACTPCNSMKGARTPEDAGMHLQPPAGEMRAYHAGYKHGLDAGRRGLLSRPRLRS